MADHILIRPYASLCAEMCEIVLTLLGTVNPEFLVIFTICNFFDFTCVVIGW